MNLFRGQKVTRPINVVTDNAVANTPTEIKCDGRCCIQLPVWRLFYLTPDDVGSGRGHYKFLKIAVEEVSEYYESWAQDL